MCTFLAQFQKNSQNSCSLFWNNFEYIHLTFVYIFDSICELTMCEDKNDPLQEVLRDSGYEVLRYVLLVAPFVGSEIFRCTWFICWKKVNRAYAYELCFCYHKWIQFLHISKIIRFVWTFSLPDIVKSFSGIINWSDCIKNKITHYDVEFEEWIIW